MSKDESNIVTLRITKFEASNLARLIESEMDEAKSFGNNSLNVKALDRLWTAIDIALEGPQAREESTKRFADKVKSANKAVFKTPISILDVAVPFSERPDNDSASPVALREAL